MNTAQKMSRVSLSSALFCTLTAALALIFLSSSALALEDAPPNNTSTPRSVSSVSSASSASPSTTAQATTELSFSQTVADELERNSNASGFDATEAAAGSSFDYIQEQLHAGLSDTLALANKILPVNWELIGQIGNQSRSGHSTCCPGYACAYGDAILDGTVCDHAYYGCGSCFWRDWGGGNSSYRCVGSSQDVLREAYEQIKQGRPTVVHVRASYGQHWITLFGYQNVSDVENLSLDNFLALDPWDASQLVASERFSLYGDGCQHISSR